MKPKTIGSRRSNPLLYLFRAVWRYSDGNRRNVVLYWFMFTVAYVVSIVSTPLIIAWLIGRIINDGVTQSNIYWLWGILALMVAESLIFWCFHGPARLLEQENAFKAKVNYRRFLLKGVLMLPMEWHTEHHSADTIDKTDKGTTALYEFADDSFEVIAVMVKLAVSYGMLVWVSPPSAYIVAGALVVIGWIVMRFDRVLVPQYQQLNHAENRIAEGIHDAVSNTTTVIILRVERLVFDAIVQKLLAPFALFGRNIRINEMKWFFVSVAGRAMTVTVLAVFLWRSIGVTPAALISSLYLLVQYTTNMRDIFHDFAWRYGDIVRRRTRVLNAEELTEEFRDENFINHVLPPRWQRVEVEGLCFSYDGVDRSDWHLDNVAFGLRRGQRVALVGETGSGKTTLLKVMRDLYHPQRLALAVDGVLVADGFEGISRAIALVPQDPEIFNTTVRENITIGADYDDATIRQFTDMACFTAVAEGLPQGFASSIKEKGVNLSTGQQQRLALSRGLLACRDKDIVLFDEPTSSLDSLTEMRVYRNIFRAFQGKTVVSSIHRLHLLPLFDVIFFFDNGRVVATGTLRELLAECPTFAKMWEQYHEHINDDNAVAAATA